MKRFIITATMLATASISAAHAAWTYETVATQGGLPFLGIRTFYNGFFKSDVTYLTYLRQDSDGTTNVMAASPSGGTWISEVIESGLAGAPARISIDFYGVPHVVYLHSPGPGNPTVVRYARRVVPNSGNCGPTLNWLCRTVPRPPIAGSLSSKNAFVAAEGVGDVVHFAYSWEYSNSQINTYYVRLNGNGTWSTPELALELRNPGSLALDSDEMPNIGYEGEINSGLGGGWLHKTKIGWTHEYYGVAGVESNDLRVSQGSPKACYASRFNSPDYPPNSLSVGYAEKSSSGVWTIAPVGIAQSYFAFIAPWDCSLSMSGAGTPSIVYVGVGNTQIRVASRNANGSWATSTLAGPAGAPPSLARVMTDKLVVAYQSPGGVISVAREQ